MPDAHDPNLLNALLDSWDRNNAIVINLLRAIPKADFGIRAIRGSPSIGELFGHVHYVRLVFISEDVPEQAVEVPSEEWVTEHDPEKMAQLLNSSAKAVRDAVKSRVEAGRAMDVHYDHPILLLQHMIWHEGYHHGQIKLVLKLSGHPMSNEVAGPLTWSVWMRKTRAGNT